MMTNVNTVIHNTIGIRGRTKVAKVEMADHQRREGHKPLEARRTTTATDG